MMAAASAPTPPAATVLASPAQSGPVALGTGPTRINLRVTAPAAPPPAAPPTGGQASASLAPLGARLQALPSERRIYVVIADLSAATTPEALYRVYLDLPEGTPDDPVNSHYLGSFNFFDAGAGGGGHQDDHQGASKPFSFDATNVITNLEARGALKQEHSVAIVPSGQPSEDAKPVVGSISIVEQ
jgi:tyrosinase